MRKRTIWIVFAAGLYSMFGLSVPSTAGASPPSWTISSGSGAGSEGSDNAMMSVACHAPSTCVAVGTAQPQNSESETSLVNLWNGQTWSTGPGSGANPIFRQVACPSTNRCFATVQTGLTQVTGYGVWVYNGQTWRSIFRRPSNQLEDAPISCSSPNHCVTFATTSTEVWSGSRWSSRPSPRGVSALSCPTAKLCVGAGSMGSRNNPTPSVAVFDGQQWRTTVFPLPVGAQTGWLGGVSCASSSWCVAVGTTQTKGEQSQTLIVEWNGKAWSQMPSPTPGITTGHLGTNGNYLIQLEGVDCSSTSSCVAVGYDTTADPSLAVTNPLTMSYDGTSWSTDPAPASATGTLSSVSCQSPGRCAAVGWTDTDSQTVAPLYEVTSALK